MMIILSSLKLVLDSYLNDKSTDSMEKVIINISNKFDLIFTIIFTLEAVFKILAFGFVLNKNSYLRDNWSRLDLIIVVFSLID